MKNISSKQVEEVQEYNKTLSFPDLFVVKTSNKHTTIHCAIECICIRDHKGAITVKLKKPLKTDNYIIVSYPPSVENQIKYEIIDNSEFRLHQYKNNKYTDGIFKFFILEL